MRELPADRWEGETGPDLAQAWGLPAVHLYARLGSTNDVARALAEVDAPHGTLVIADEQLAGRGRSGRGWESPPGLGVWMSMVARPPAGAAPGLLPILVGLATAMGLEHLVERGTIQLKWPNDLLLADRKLAGILCEGSWDSGGLGAVVVGIGINVLHRAEDFPESVRDTATSLRLGAGWHGSRAEVAGAVAPAVARALAQAPALLSGTQLAAVRSRDALEGKPVRVLDRQELAGTALGISPAGGLLIRTNEGRLQTITSGTVRLAPHLTEPNSS